MVLLKYSDFKPVLNLDILHWKRFRLFRGKDTVDFQEREIAPFFTTENTKSQIIRGYISLLQGEGNVSSRGIP